ncbi:DUF7224 domain-containing protein [Saccharopolyspora spinosa]|uniref:DUF7224 domain-containing protein n=1 Tax=Saccharopolyspora spinosa TaxID=60894 RepID=A0A2N3XVR7_SACSN|nr:hypothetical protein [Saccharopolyspora spinosa]PKW14774.1 hypothetical protein A8926_2421 [Saccharopolyspora spinosa]
MSLAGIVVRRSTALPAAPLIVAFGWFAGKQLEELWAVDWALGSGQVNRSLLWPVALVAAVAAWDTSRMRRLDADMLERTYPRSGIAYFVLSGVPALVVGMLSSVAVLLAVATSMRGGGQPLWLYLLVAELMFVAAVAIGVAGGYVLPRYLAAPAVGIGLWLLLAYGSISDNTVIRRLVVSDIECCDVSQDLVVTTLAGQGLWLVGVAVICAAIVCWRRPRKAWRFVGLAAVVILSGFGLLDRGNFQLLTMRQPREAVCQDVTGVRVCMWPEHRDQLPRWSALAQQYRAMFSDLGPQPVSFAENGTDWSAAAMPIGVIRPGQSDQDLLQSLGLSTLQYPPECARVDAGQPAVMSYRLYPGMEGRDLVAAWMNHRIRPELPPRLLGAPERTSEVERLLAAPEPVQLDWARQAIRANSDCATPAPELP